MTSPEYMESSLVSRAAQAQRIRARYPDQLPVILRRARRSELPEIGKSKFIVRGGMLVGEFRCVVLRYMDQAPASAHGPKQAIHLFANNVQLEAGAEMSDVYEAYRDDDGFLYVAYSAEESATDDATPLLAPYIISLLETGEGADVMLRAGPERLPAHRLMLLRVPYFRSILDGPLAEGRAERCECSLEASRAAAVELQDVEAETLRRVLRFVYTDDAEVAVAGLEAGAAMALGRAADRYGLPRLLRSAEAALEGLLRAPGPQASASVLDVLQFARQHGCRLLRRVALEHVQQHFAEVAMTRRFRDLAEADPELYKDIVEIIGLRAAASVAVEQHKRRRTL